MEINVTNEGLDYRAVAGSGMELSIVFGEGKPGEDKSMNPVEVFLSSLALCIAAMLRKYCNSHNLEVPKIKVSIAGDFEPGASACENITAQIEVEGDWDDRRKAAFMKVAETCPVGNTICTCSHVDMEVV